MHSKILVRYIRRSDEEPESQVSNGSFKLQAEITYVANILDAPKSFVCIIVTYCFCRFLLDNGECVGYRKQLPDGTPGPFVWLTYNEVRPVFHS